MTRRSIPASPAARKSGGFPNFTNNAPSGLKDEPYKDSSSWSYEIGSKNRFLDGRAELNASLFYNSVKDENLFALDSASFTFVPKPMDTRNYGMELEGSLQLAEHWKVSGGAGYTIRNYANVSDDVAASSRRAQWQPGYRRYRNSTPT
ncbi:Outer membrane receptor for monomeric catechols [Raoultella terrigena]|uniref:Outer membrane receptor for monomeric catechols n=1 Tax=Raoultella terrigena TaxID=577 RepID=A0A3P8LZU1_RAOTE|nr:Outer membrane receptor for monomeric catechols [Raoultella terrigena]